MHRRNFIRKSILTAGAGCRFGILSGTRAFGAAPKRILVLGGTVFVGPALVNAALSAGHQVTLFNRGITNPDLFPHIEKLRGHRSTDPDDQDLTRLAHRRWDAVVDVWPHDPTLVASQAEFLKDRAPHYLYISSIAAYDHKEYWKGGLDENAPLESWDSPARFYSRGKAESERRLHAIIGDRLTVVRPGPIKGRRDDTPDLLSWLLRAQHAGRHIAPGDGSDPVEFIDVKDVARFLVMAIERSLYGTFNLTGRPMTFRQFLDGCKSATGSDAEFVWIPGRFLHEHQLESDAVLQTFAGNFPFWRPDPASRGLYQISSEKAYRAGFRTRPFKETALDCLNDFYSRDPLVSNWNDYLRPEKETEVLAAWQSSGHSSR